MIEGRRHSAAVKISEDEWWITGGDDSGDVNSTEIFQASTKQFVPYIELPKTMYEHNIFSINDTHFALIDSGPEDVYIFDR